MRLLDCRMPKFIFTVRTGCLVVLFAAILLSSSQILPAAETNDTAITDFTNLVARINAKLESGKMQEADFADDLKEFDVLLAKHKDAPPEERAQILFTEAQLYLQPLDEPEKTLELYQRIKRDFPMVQIDGGTDEAIRGIQDTLAKWKIWHSLAVGQRFPDFAANDVNGEPLSLAKNQGKVVLVDFWATWCPPCRAELPNLLSTYTKYHDRGFEIVGVSLDDNLQKLMAFTKSMNMPWPQSCDAQGWNGKLVGQYGVYQLPSSALLNSQGIIIAKDLRGDALEHAVAKALATK